jgi:hypothetical protein
MADDVVVVDNSPIPDPQLHARLVSQDIPLIDNRNVGGLARGLNLGIRELFARGCEVACIFDIATVLFFEKNKWRNLEASFIGILDGLRGKWGTFADR